MASYERVTMYRSNGLRICKIECSRFVHADNAKREHFGEKYVEYEFTKKRERTNRRTQAVKAFPMVVVAGWGHFEPESFMNDAGTENRYEVGSDEPFAAFFKAFDKSGLEPLFDTRKLA